MEMKPIAHDQITCHVSKMRLVVHILIAWPITEVKLYAKVIFLLKKTLTRRLPINNITK